MLLDFFFKVLREGRGGDQAGEPSQEQGRSALPASTQWGSLVARQLTASQLPTGSPQVLSLPPLSPHLTKSDEIRFQIQVSNFKVKGFVFFFLFLSFLLLMLLME